MNRTLIVAAALVLALALGGNAEARPHHGRHHRTDIAPMGRLNGFAGGGAPHHRVGEFHGFRPSPVQRYFAPVFRWGRAHGR
ncbi:MAG TPA: hypothetical protein VJ770_23340 [Stellaceae bacterium]|nr:hypothetical protein [Stellaceae bacterium]